MLPPPLAFRDPEFRLDLCRVVVVVAHLGGYRLAAVSARWLRFSPEDQTPNATGFVRAPQRPDDRKFGSSRVLQINLPPPALSIRSRRPDHRPRQSVAFWFSRAPRRGSLQRTSHATPIFGRVRPLTPKAAQPSPARGWPRDHAAAQSLARTPLARQQPAPALPPPTPQAPSTTPPTLRTPG